MSATANSVREAMSLAGIPAKLTPSTPPVNTMPPRSASSIPMMVNRVSTPRPSRADAQATREARAALRRDQANTRLVVLSIWGAAVVLAAILALLAYTT